MANADPKVGVLLWGLRTAQLWPVAIRSDLSIAAATTIGHWSTTSFPHGPSRRAQQCSGSGRWLAADELTLSAIKQSTDRQRPANSPTRIGNLMIYR